MNKDKDSIRTSVHSVSVQGGGSVLKDKEVSHTVLANSNGPIVLIKKVKPKKTEDRKAD